MKKLLVIGSLLFVICYLLFAVVKAAEINYAIPGPNPTAGNPVGWIGNFYSFSLMIAGLLAFGVIVYGALEYALAAGNPSKQSDARDRIFQALLGLLLLMGAYIILNTINPNLTNLKMPGLQNIQAPPASSYEKRG